MPGQGARAAYPIAVVDEALRADAAFVRRTEHAVSIAVPAQPGASQQTVIDAARLSPPTRAPGPGVQSLLAHLKR